MKAARENAPIKHYLRALEKHVKQHLNALNSIRFRTALKSSLFCSAQGKALKKIAFNAPLCYLGSFNATKSFVTV